MPASATPSAAPLELEGRVAVVTGAASGIGLALASACAERGMRVVLADVEADALERATGALAARGADVVGVPTDVTDEASVQALRDAAFERFGSVHLLVNNAGVLGAFRRSWTISAAEWRWIVDVNLLGVVHGINAFVPRLLEQDEGHVLNTASSAGVTAGHAFAAYAATKQGVVGLSEALAHDLAEVGSRVGVTVVCPSLVRTRIHDSERNRPADITSNAESESGAALRESVRVANEERGLDPADVARVALEGVTTGRFYVLTHDRTRELVRARYDAMMSGTRPAREVIST